MSTRYTACEHAVMEKRRQIKQRQAAAAAAPKLQFCSRTAPLCRCPARAPQRTPGWAAPRVCSAGEQSAIRLGSEAAFRGVPLHLYACRPVATPSSQASTPAAERTQLQCLLLQLPSPSTPSSQLPARRTCRLAREMARLLADLAGRSFSFSLRFCSSSLKIDRQHEQTAAARAQQAGAASYCTQQRRLWRPKREISHCQKAHQSLTAPRQCAAS